MTTATPLQEAWIVVFFATSLAKGLLAPMAVCKPHILCFGVISAKAAYDMMPIGPHSEQDSASIEHPLPPPFAMTKLKCNECLFKKMVWMNVDISLLKESRSEVEMLV